MTDVSTTTSSGSVTNFAEVTTCWDLSQMSLQGRAQYEARVGIINYLATLDFQKTPSLSSSVLDNFVNDSTITNDIAGLAKKGCSAVLRQTGPGRSVLGAVETVGKKWEQIKKKIIAKLESFFSRLINNLKKKYAEVTWVVSYLSEMAGWLVGTLVRDITHAIPGWGYVQDAADLYKGVKKAVVSASRYFELKSAGKGVMLLDGHPDDIAYWLKNHIGCDAMLGVKDVLVTSGKFAVKMAGDAAGGLGTIIGLLVGALTRIGALVDYIVQRASVDKALKTARKEKDRVLNKNGLVNDCDAFNKWFSRTLKVTPIFASLVLHAGVAAHPYNFLELINFRGHEISAQRYARGAKYIQKLKEAGGQHIRDYSEGYGLSITSSSAWQNALLKQQLEGGAVIESDLVLPSPDQWRRNAIRRKGTPPSRGQWHRQPIRRKATV